MSVLAGARVVVAMSGGVDSSVAAALLRERGLDVIGVTLHLWDYPDDGSVRGRCCAPEDQHDARRVADRLGIPHYSFDRRKEFLSEVVEPFVEAYLRGETPSPCVACNRGPKLRELFSAADALGATYVATGHYARVVEHEGRVWLARAMDRDKDQSYFLHALPRALLARMIFPLETASKPEVRALAATLDLPGASKGESQELCFVPTGRYDAFVEARAPGRLRPGPILGPDGREVGHHEGVHRFTVGQRRGLGVALGAPMHVVSIDGDAVRLGPKSALTTRALALELSTFEGPAFEADVQVRSGHGTTRAEITPGEGGRAWVGFREPIPVASVGQFAVGYDGDRVLGGGRICAVEREEPSL